jgi:hypothetical protein
MTSTPRPMCRAARDLIVAAKSGLDDADATLATAGANFRAGKAVIGVLDLADGRAAIAAARSLLVEALNCAGERRGTP